MSQKKIERAVETLMKRMGLSKANARQRLERLALRDLCTLDEAADRVTAADEFFAEIDARSQGSLPKGRARQGHKLEGLRSRRSRRHPGAGPGDPG